VAGEAVSAAELELLTTRMDAVDVALYTAEVSGNVAEQIVQLRLRAAAWRDYGVLLVAAGKDGAGAVLAAMRDERRAAELEEGPDGAA
jgi:hypothetical protein